jgi:D-hexose-6-phosphate mutarotase
MTIDELNRKYGGPGRIVFRVGHCGYPEVVLACKYGSAEIALMGANVLSYHPTGQAPVIFRPSKRDYNRGESFHGGIPVCWPQFGRLSIPGMAPHGFARFMPFEVRSSEYSEEMAEVTLGLKSNAETRTLWPYDFDLEIKISVSMKLNLSMKTVNTGKEPFEFTAGFHPYFRVSERDKAVVKGLDGVPYIYADDMSEHVQKGDLPVTSAVDHVFTLPKAVKHEAAIIDSGLRRAIAVVSSGGERTVLWNPGPDGVLPDFEKDDWRKFVCLEPVTSWPKSNGVMKPGMTHELLVAIQSSVDMPAQ